MVASQIMSASPSCFPAARQGGIPDSLLSSSRSCHPSSDPDPWGIKGTQTKVTRRTANLGHLRGTRSPRSARHPAASARGCLAARLDRVDGGVAAELGLV